MQNTPPKKRNGTQLQKKAHLLKQELQQMRYKGHVQIEKVLNGDASVYLPAMNFILFVFSPRVADFIADHGFSHLAKNDYAFMMNVFGVVTKLFGLQPPFKIEEFFSPNNAVDRKVSFTLKLI